MDRVAAAASIMSAYAARTGITSSAAQRRYLWTDAFAVCTCLSLQRRTRSTEWRDLGYTLIEQVHHVLGRHRSDDPRTGWISGLSESQGERHPTAGGLRIGKPLPERRPADPFDDELEWERDGQYYHYLTRWTHALDRASAEWQDARLHEWAVELARAAHAAFAHEAGDGLRLFWKMSIDLTRPLVASMGQHDALDGLITTAALHSARDDLRKELRELALMCASRQWATTDPLGLGGLLTDALFLARRSDVVDLPEELLTHVLRDAARSMKYVNLLGSFDRPAHERLPFRELGLGLGLAAIERLADLGRTVGLPAEAAAAVDSLMPSAPLRERIEDFWLDHVHQGVDSWLQHEDINAIMLAASILPEGYLD